MTLFNKTADHVKALLGQMTFSQKMLIVLLAGVVVGSVAWMANYAGESDMVSLFGDKQFPAEVQGRLANTLKASGIEHAIKHGQVLVPASRREAAQAALAVSGDLRGQDFSVTFELLVKDSNIWRSESEKERMWKVAVENELAAVLNRFPGVGDAKVIIDRPAKATFGSRPAAAGSAAIHLRMQPGTAIDKKLVVAVADWVSGAVRDLPRERIKVVDSTSGRSFRIPPEDSAIPADLLDLAKAHEDHLSASIEKALGIDNVLISVSVKVDPVARQGSATTYSKDNVVSVPRSETGVKSNSMDGAGPAGEPGVVPNTAAAVSNAPASAVASHRSQTEERTEYDIRFGDTRTTTSEPAGSVRDVTASVNIPRSYFSAAYKAEHQKDADASALKEFIAAEIAKIRPKVLTAIGLADKPGDEKVSVGWYYDAAVASAEPSPETQKAGAANLLTENARTIGLGALALFSLGMMLLMMRKAASSGTVTVATSAAGASAGGAPEPAVSLGLDSVAESAGGGFFQGVEVDEETMQTQKMVEQVAGMVKENPDAAASLIRRWVSKKGR